MSYQFSVIVNLFPKDDDESLEVADKLGATGCLDASVGGHVDGVEILFDRDAASFDAAIQSGVAAVELAGYEVKRVELARESIAANG